MKFCQLLTYPEAQLRGFHAARPELRNAPFKEQTAELANDAPDATVFWSPSLVDAGHEARLIVANDQASQQRWAFEKLGDFKPKDPADWMREIVLEQLRKFKVDVLCVCDPVTFDARFIERIKNRPRWIIGHNSALTPSRVDWRGFDLMLSPHQACVRQAWRQGARDARLFPSGFPRSVAEAVFQEPVTHDVVYCGRWLPDQARRTERITALAESALRKDRPFRLSLNLEVPDGADLPPAVRQLNRGPRHGLARYRAIAGATIAVVEEPDAALGAALPAGVFEGTGLGIFTLVEENEMLPEVFAAGTELVTYHGTTDLISRLDEYLAADGKRATIAVAGQERCLTAHDMERRMKALLALVENDPGGIGAAARRWCRRVG